MELSPPAINEQEQCSPERHVGRCSLLLERFREVDTYVENPPRDAEQADIDAVEELHDQFLGILAELPERDVELAKETYEALTDSDNPRDRFWAATFFSRMLPVDKPMGLSMLGRLIGREETEHAVMDRAWEELSTTVAGDNLLRFSEAIEYVDKYHARLRERMTARITQARGKKPDDHTRYDQFPPYVPPED